MAYYYINGIHFEFSKKKIEHLTGYLTDSNHDNFFPPQNFSRKQVIDMSKEGDTFFVEDGCYRKLKIKIYLFENEEFLRIDCHPAPFDYFG